MGAWSSRALRAGALTAALVAGGARAAGAHAGGGGFILLLPTHLYVVGGTVVVAASFLLIALAPPGAVTTATRLAWQVARLGDAGRVRALADVVPSLLTLTLVVVLVVAGLTGSRDPLANPLPLAVWSVWWIGLTFLHALLGNLWAWLHPWRGLYRLATARGPLVRWRETPPLRYPAWAGYWPAVLLFLAFAWFELVHPAPADPAVLATVVWHYLLGTFVGICLFGEAAWLQHAEPFAVFFRIISWLSPVGLERADPGCGGCPLRCTAGRDCLACAWCAADGPWTLRLTVPPLHLLRVGPLPPSGVAFLLLALASVSFDGLSRTFAWLGLVGANPLEYPGRTALVSANTVGLVGLAAALVGAYSLALTASRGDAGPPPARLRGRLVLSIVPIALGYHAAHYLPVFLVDVQRALRAASDPFALGWNLLGTGELSVVTSFLTDPARLYPLWYTQVGLIVGAHVAAVAIAHALILDLGARPGEAVRGQLPLAGLMVGYTMFGLWLLATPSVG